MIPCLEQCRAFLANSPAPDTHLVRLSPEFCAEVNRYPDLQDGISKDCLGPRSAGSGKGATDWPDIIGHDNEEDIAGQDGTTSHAVPIHSTDVREVLRIKLSLPSNGILI